MNGSYHKESLMRRKGVWIAGTIVLLAIFGVSVLRKKPLSVTFREVRVTRSDLDVTILSTGGVQPQNRLEIKPPVPGRVEQVLVREGQIVRKGQVLAWMSSTERAALLDASRSKGPEELARWQELYRPTPIMAPIAGTIILKSVESGQTFTATDSVFVMSDRLTVKAQVDETDIAQIKIGQAATLVLDAYPSEVIEAVVDQIAFDAKTVNNVTTYVVDVLPKVTPATMRSGMTANVTFSVASKKNVLVVPSEALKVKDGKYFLQTKGDRSSLTSDREVEVGLNDGKRTEILKGIAENDVVLIAELSSTTQTKASNPFSPMGNTRRGSGGR